MALVQFRAPALPQPPAGLPATLYLQQLVNTLQLYLNQLDSQTPNQADTYTAITFKGIPAILNVTTVGRLALTPSAGWVVFDTDLASLCMYSGTYWYSIPKVLLVNVIKATATCTAKPVTITIV
jgi:hypothetical protein